MRFTRWLAAAWASLLAACGSPVQAPPATGGGSVPAQPASVAGTRAPAPPAAGAGTAPQPAATRGPQVGTARNWEEYKLRAARRIVETSAGETFHGPLPDPLQSIPVLLVHLNRDGSVRDITVLRTPRQSPQTIAMAMRAIRRAGPFEPVGHLPQPWQFSETFLYNEDLRFQLRTLVEAAP
ncbi:MAG TPA: hypothetical protein VEA40_23295 [Ramlibacter sp.]|nr:hypothetical protein [Ramlibacter sp.]